VYADENLRKKQSLLFLDCHPHSRLVELDTPEYEKHLLLTEDAQSYSNIQEDEKPSAIDFG
jgi:hypothetical protein